MMMLQHKLSNDCWVIVMASLSLCGLGPQSEESWVWLYLLHVSTPSSFHPYFPFLLTEKKIIIKFSPCCLCSNSRHYCWDQSDIYSISSYYHHSTWGIRSTHALIWYIVLYVVEVGSPWYRCNCQLLSEDSISWCLIRPSHNHGIISLKFNEN